MSKIKDRIKNNNVNCKNILLKIYELITILCQSPTLIAVFVDQCSYLPYMRRSQAMRPHILFYNTLKSRVLKGNKHNHCNACHIYDHKKYQIHSVRT